MRICHIFLKRILNFKATAINIIVEKITITHLWFIENSYFPATLSPVNAELISAKENSFPLNSYTKKFTKPNNRSTQWEIIQVIAILFVIRWTNRYTTRQHTIFKNSFSSVVLANSSGSSKRYCIENMLNVAPSTSAAAANIIFLFIFSKYFFIFVTKLYLTPKFQYYQCCVILFIIEPPHMSKISYIVAVKHD